MLVWLVSEFLGNISIPFQMLQIWFYCCFSLLAFSMAEKKFDANPLFCRQPIPLPPQKEEKVLSLKLTKMRLNTVFC